MKNLLELTGLDTYNKCLLMDQPHAQVSSPKDAAKNSIPEGQGVHVSHVCGAAAVNKPLLPTTGKQHVYVQGTALTLTKAVSTSHIHYRFSFLFVAVIKHPDKIQLKGRRLEVPISSISSGIVF